MMKRILSLIICVISAISLCGCSLFVPEDSPAVLWHKESAETFAQKNLSYETVVYENGTSDAAKKYTAKYGDGAVLISESDISGEQTLCYVKDGEKAYAYLYNAEYDIWIRSETEYDGNMFYPRALFERIDAIGAYIEMGELVKEGNTYTGSYLSGSYNYNDENHIAVSLAMKISEGKVSRIEEEYKINKNGDILRYKDETDIFDIGKTIVTAPENYINENEIEAYKEKKEKEYLEGLLNGNK